MSDEPDIGQRCVEVARAANRLGLTTEEAAVAMRPAWDAMAEVWEAQRPLRETLAAVYMAEWRREPWRLNLYRRARVLAS